MKSLKKVVFTCDGKAVETKKTFTIKHVRAYYAATNPPRAHISKSMSYDN